MDPLSLRIVIIGVILIGLGVGADVTLEVSGHAGSEIAPVLVKVVTAGLAVISLVLAGKSGQGPNPPQSLKELFRGPPKLKVTPAGPPPSGPRPS